MQMRSCLGMIIVILLSYQTAAMTQRNPEVKIDRWPGVVPVYTCHQVPDERIIIDGQMTENAWANHPRISFADITHGTPPAHDGYAIVTWDQTDLYIGFHLTQPNRIAEITMTEQGYDSESRIMLTDQFCEIFLDPDGDGVNYLEWHFNSAGAKADLLLSRPSSWTAALDLGVPFAGYGNTADWDWSLPGVRHAVHVDEMAGAWQVEVAIPWASLASLHKRRSLQMSQVSV